MNLFKRCKKYFFISISLFPFVLSANTSLNYAHFMPATSWQNKTLFSDWAAAVNSASNGELTVNIYPAQTLGRAPQGYDNAIAGIADIAWTVQGYTAGRFPLTHIVELPGLFDSAAVGSCAFQKLYDSGVLDAEYNETHVLFVHTHGPGHIFTRDKPIKTLADIQNLTLRRPTAVVGNLLSELGAEPVGMPAPRIFEQVQRGVIDGYMLPWEAVQGFKLGEVTQHHTEFGFYSLAFVATMNKRRYENLSPQAKKAIDANSGMPWAMIAGRGYDQGDRVGKAALASSLTSHTITDNERSLWQAAAARATKAYLAELDSKGLPGTETYLQFIEYVKSCQ